MSQAEELLLHCCLSSPSNGISLFGKLAYHCPASASLSFCVCITLIPRLRNDLIHDFETLLPALFYFYITV